MSTPVDNFDSVKEWQEFFDTTFPEGVSVYRPGDELHFHSTEIQVKEVNEGEPLLRFSASHLQTKIMNVVLESMEEREPGVYIIHTADGERDWTFSNNLDPAMAAELKSQRDEEAALRAKYAD